MTATQTELFSLTADGFAAPMSHWDWENQHIPVQERSIEQSRMVSIARARESAPHRCGATVTPIRPDLPSTDAGQLPESEVLPSTDAGQLPESEVLPFTDARQLKNEGDAGTWIEYQDRKMGSYKYLRWREGTKKRSRYLGKVA